MALTKEKQESFLLIPVMPTANGRLHLGHIAGPYLKMDILGRYLKSRGHNVKLISGTCGYDSYVEYKSYQESSTPKQVTNTYHELIAEDFRSIDIDFDYFINTQDEQYKTNLRNITHSTIQELIEKNNAVLKTEQVPYDLLRQRFLSGAWLKGQCPVCDYTVSGYYCEKCSYESSSEELTNMIPKIDDYQVEIRKIQNLFLNNLNQNHLLSFLQERNLDSSIIENVQRYFAHARLGARITTPTCWGISWSNSHTNSVLFNHPGVYQYALLIGQIYSKMIKNDGNAFDFGSTVKTVLSFGIDNTIAMLVGMLGMTLLHGRYKPFDYFLVNQFLKLDGKKFSTSRKHVIPVAPFIKSSAISTDCLRLYLALFVHPDSESNFSKSEFIKHYNSVIDKIYLPIYRIVKNQEILVKLESQNDWQSKLQTCLALQQEAISLPKIDFSKFWQAVNIWLDTHTKQHCQYWWLKGFVLLIYPIMPKLAKELWCVLGYEGNPCSSNLQIYKNPNYNFNISYFKKLDNSIFS